MTITINGTSGIAGVDGSASTPAAQGADTNTGIFYGTDIVGVSTGGTERMRINSSGNVGIGTSSPLSAAGTNLSVVGTSANARLQLSSSGGSGRDWRIVSNTAGALDFYDGTAAATRATIDSSGRRLIAATSIINGADTAPLQVSGGSVTPIALRGGTNGYQIAFYNTAGNAVIGSITGANGATTAYNTASDYRLKENIQPMQNALAVVQQLNPVTYNWKADGSDGQGFIAHELQAVVPDCVTGEKDAVNAEGNPVYQGIDTSFLVATLTKAIQELSAKVDAQQAEIEALKGVQA